VAYYNARTVTTLSGVYRLTLRIRRCIRPACPWYKRAYRPEAEGAWALPHGEFGLDVLALVGHLRVAEHRSVPEIHPRLLARGVRLAERTVSNLLEHFAAIEALRLALLAFKDRHNTGWLIERHGHRSPAAVSAACRPPGRLPSTPELAA
jgi:hypothetical protein